MPVPDAWSKFGAARTGVAIIEIRCADISVATNDGPVGTTKEAELPSGFSISGTLPGERLRQLDVDALRVSPLDEPASYESIYDIHLLAQVGHNYSSALLIQESS